MSLVQIEIQDKVAWATLNRPEKLNALNDDLMKALDGALTELAFDPKVQVVVLTGAGDRAFVAGADIAELKALDPAGAHVQAQVGQALFQRVEGFPKPVVAAVNGHALGGGLELALACHIRVASDTARFGLPETGLGILPGYGGTQRLPRLVGKSVALDMILTGEAISASDALAVGLVSRVFAASDLRAGVDKLARAIVARGPLALRYALAAVHHGQEMPQEQGLHYEAALFGLCAGTQDAQEGFGAFLEKRTPKFKGF